MSFVSTKWQPWILEEEASIAIIKQAYEAITLLNIRTLLMFTVTALAKRY
jgi:hypothetical protein